MDLAKLILLVSGAFILGACQPIAAPTTTSSGGGSTIEKSASGAAAGAIGGALSTSNSSSTLASFNLRSESRTPHFWALMAKVMQPTADASVACPTYLTTGTGCSVSGTDMWLTQNACSYGSGTAIWRGYENLSMSAGTAACGMFPNPGANGVLYRQYVSASGSTTPSTGNILVSGYNVVVDDATVNLGNFDNASINTIHNGGYGTAVSFDANGARTSVTIGHRTKVAGIFDHSVAGTLTITEASAAATSRTISGSVTVYHNLIQVVGTSTFTNVVHENTCCFPTSGTITTAFAAGNTAPTGIGNLVVGKSESLTFTGCGTATYTAYDGTTSTVTLNRCF